jgi:hypothetical protein
MSNRPLRRGDFVEVLGPAEIIATLDQHACIDNLPFMPEMVSYCGRRFRVDRRTERVCDTVHYSGSRRLADAVMLEDLRCDGAAHEGCQAHCRLIWKEAWLRRIDAAAPSTLSYDPADFAALMDLTTKHVQRPVAADAGADVRWVCQTTELLNATSAVKIDDLRSYAREITTHNVSVAYFLRVMLQALVREGARRLGFKSVGAVRTAPPGATVAERRLNLQPGEWVRVRSAQEIAATLSPTGHLRGLSFDPEMLVHCGKSFRVRRRVTRIIDDRDGRMLNIKGDCIMLENVYCAGECSPRRLFCTRGITPYFRESWLERAHSDQQTESQAKQA